MLYVTVGLVLMFAGFTYFGVRSINRATELVYDERLSIAETTTGILERDFLHVARDIEEGGPTFLGRSDTSLDVVASGLLDHLSETDPFEFFNVTGVWILDRQGGLLAEAGRPVATSKEEAASLVSSITHGSTGQYVVLPAVGSHTQGVPFATVGVPVGNLVGSPGLVVAAHTESINSSGPYIPTSYSRQRESGGGSDTELESPRTEYHLEVVSPDGRVVLGIGEDEHPGEPSIHFPVIQSLVAEGKPATMLHRPESGDNFEPHVMAVVPFPSSQLVLVLEQPVDVALAQPIQLRRSLFLLTSLGFMVTLLVAWVTTRRVVKPTEQLTAAAQRIAEGDLESPIDVSAQDEVGKLAESLDSMRQELQSAYQQAANINRELESQVQERTARLGEVLRKVISAQEEERHRLARELHDESAQAMGALSLALDRARDSLQSTAGETLEQIREAKDIATRLLEETRRLIMGLRPLVLDDMGLTPAIRWYVETHLEEQGVAATIESNQPANRLPKHIEVSLFRVIQEAVNNIVKHAKARRAQIRLTFLDSVARVVVRDDGRGFDVDSVLGASTPVENVGIVGMQERVRLLNGRIDIRSKEGAGTKVFIEIPIAEEIS